MLAQSILTIKALTLLFLLCVMLTIGRMLANYRVYSILQNFVFKFFLVDIGEVGRRTTLPLGMR